MPVWNHVRQSLNGGSTGEAFYSTLNNNAFSIPERLAREALQNSRDATLKGKRLRVDFRFSELEGERKLRFIQALDLGSLLERRSLLGLPLGTCLDHLTDPTIPLRLLSVADFGTFGLHGYPYQSGSHLRRLLLTLGDRSKVRESGHSGGSYGFGKAVYSVSSRIRTIVAYSRFDEYPDHGVNTRLLGCGYFKSHEDESTRLMFDGRAIFGEPKLIGDEQVYAPLENEAAHELAERLVLPMRTESGTTMLIIDPQVDLTELTRGIETWWWPALVQKSMDVTVHDIDGTRHVPRTQRPDLRPFVKAFHIAARMADPIGKHEHRLPFNRQHGVSIGDGGAVLVDEVDLADIPIEERDSKVALIRGPRMVVQYMRVGGSGPIVYGAFVASEEIDDWLRSSENPAHDVWDHTTPDLDGYGPAARDVVASLQQRVRNAISKFRRETMPKQEISRRSLRVFEAALGRLFKNKSSGIPDRPDKPTNPVHFTFSRQPTVAAQDTDGEQIRFSTKFSLSLDAEHPVNSGDVELFIDCDIVEDEGGTGSALPVDVKVADAALERAEEGRFVGRLHKGQPISVEVKSKPYERSWTVRFQPRVEFTSETTS